MSGMKVKVQKKNPAGEVTYEYEGVLLSRDDHSIVLEALFDRADMPFMDVVFKAGDRFVEYYYTDRWYNIFVIHDHEDGKIKGWYCNIGKPAEFEDSIVSYIDLALDLWVSTSGKQTVLDEDEFEALELNEELRTGARKGLDELKQLFLNDKPPS
jgi:protein associated with RNAse G/E